MDRLGAMLMQVAPQAASNPDGSRTPYFAGASPQLGGASQPPPTMEGSPVVPPAPSVEGSPVVPPIPNPPLAPPPPPVNSASFSPMGGVGAGPSPPMIGAGAGTSPMGATPQPPPGAPPMTTEPSPQVGDDTVRQAIMRAIKMGNNPAILGMEGRQNNGAAITGYQQGR